MTLARLGLGATGALLIALYGVLAVRWTGAGSAWAATLRQPSWQPPDIVFGVIWPLNFVAMAVAGLCHVHANALVHTVVQSHSPPAYRGRTMALFNMSQMLSTAGSMLIGLLAFVLGSRGAVATMGVLGAVGIVLLVLLMPRARQIK